jgi:hypothetical protein
MEMTLVARFYERLGDHAGSWVRLSASRWRWRTRCCGLPRSVTGGVTALHGSAGIRR